MAFTGCYLYAWSLMCATANCSSSSAPITTSSTLHAVMARQKNAGTLLVNLILVGLVSQSFVATVECRSSPGGLSELRKTHHDSIKKPDCTIVIDPLRGFGRTPAHTPVGSGGGSHGRTPDPAPGGHGTTPTTPSPGGGYGTPTPATPSHGGYGTTPTPTPATPSPGGGYGTPAPAHGGYGTTPTPATPSHGGYGTTPTPATPSHGGYGTTPTPTPATPSPGGGYGTPAPSHGAYGTTPTPTPAAPSPGGGYGTPAPTHGGYGTTPTPATPSHGGYGTTPIPTPATPTTPGISTPTPFIPIDPHIPGGFPAGTCDYWRKHPLAIWAVLGHWPGTVGHFFGSAPGLMSLGGKDVSLQDALANTRIDGVGALLREGTASLLNSLADSTFPFTTEQVKDAFAAAAASDRAAATQAEVFKKANEGRL